MKHITIRNIPPGLSRALEEERRRRGTSLNQTVLDLLSQGLGVGGAGIRRNGIGRLAGTWTSEECEAFDAAVAQFEAVDEDLWKKPSR